MDAATLGAALALVEGMVPGLTTATANANNAAGAANQAAGNAAKVDVALAYYTSISQALIRQQQKEIDALKSAVAALT